MTACSICVVGIVQQNRGWVTLQGMDARLELRYVLLEYLRSRRSVVSVFAVYDPRSGALVANGSSSITPLYERTLVESLDKIASKDWPSYAFYRLRIRCIKTL